MEEKDTKEVQPENTVEETAAEVKATEAAEADVTEVKAAEPAEVKAEAEELFNSFGLTVTDAINVFLRQSIMRGGFPFEVVRYKPDALTQASIYETEQLKNNSDEKSFTI